MSFLGDLKNAAIRTSAAGLTGGLSELYRAQNGPLPGEDINSLDDLKNRLTPNFLEGTDTTQLQADRQRALDQYASLNAERLAYQGTNPGTVAARGINAPAINDAQAQEIRSRQLAALSGLEGAAAGTAPSAALAQLRIGQAANARNALGLAAGARGSQGIAARRAALAGIQQGGLDTNAQAALLRAQEVAQARGQLTGALTGVRTEDYAKSLQEAQNQFEANKALASNDLSAQQANQRAALENEQIRNQYRLGLQQGTQQASNQGQEATKSALDIQEAGKKRQSEMFAKGAEAGTKVAQIFSDMRVKTDVKAEPESDKEAFLRSLEDAINFKYKDQDMGKGTQHGQSAQNLESGSEIGKDVVSKSGKDGMRSIDLGKMVMALSEALGHVNHKVDRLAGAY